MKLNLSYETLDEIKNQMEILEIQNFETPLLTFYEDISIEGLEGNYGVTMIAKHKDPIGGSKLITINCAGMSTSTNL